MKIGSGYIVMTCFTSVFLLKDADQWRSECWEMIKCRNDCMFSSSLSVMNDLRTSGLKQLRNAAEKGMGGLLLMQW